MKNMIITIGAVILILTISGYQIKLNNMLREKEELKFAADEAAATAALFFDWEKYSEGYFVFDEEKARKEGRKILKLNLKGKEPISSFSFDNDQDRPIVTVRLTMGELSVKSVYEYVP